MWHACLVIRKPYVRLVGMDPVQRASCAPVACTHHNPIKLLTVASPSPSPYSALSLSLSLSLSLTLSQLCSHCNSYAGSICSGFIRDSISVYIDGVSIHGNYSTLLNHAASLITNIRGTYSAKSNTTSDLDLLNKCKHLAEGVACHTVFPYCSPQEGEINPTPRPICKSTCDAFQAGGICESFINSQMSPDLYNSLMSKCDDRNYPAGGSPECIPVPLEPQEIGINL